MPWILAFHLFGNIVWIGSLITVVALMAMVPDEVGGARERIIVAARKLTLGFAGLGAVLTIIMGIVLIAIDPGVMRQGWIHAKLTAVAVLVALHVYVYRRIVRSELEPAGVTQFEFEAIGTVVALLTIVAILLTMFRPF